MAQETTRNDEIGICGDLPFRVMRSDSDHPVHFARREDAVCTAESIIGHDIQATVEQRKAGQWATIWDPSADVEIKIAGTIIITDPLTAAGGAVFGAKGRQMIGAFMFSNKSEDPRIALQAVADSHGLKVLWS